MIIEDARSKHCAQVTEEGYLKVCFCDETCDGHAKLKQLLDAGYKMQIFIKNKNGDIVPMGESKQNTPSPPPGPPCRIMRDHWAPFGCSALVETKESKRASEDYRTYMNGWSDCADNHKNRDEGN